MSRHDADTYLGLLRDVVRASTQAGQPAPLFKELDAALEQLVGHKLFTLMVLDEASGVAERVYTNKPDAYPVSGRKELADTPWYRRVIVGRQHYLGRTREDIRWAFPDHALIEELGCRSVINVLVMHDDAVLGSANPLHEERHYGRDDIADCLPFVQLLVPAFQRLSGALA